MNKSKAMLIVLCALIQISSAFAIPVIESFKTQPVFPSMMQLTWTISDDKGLAKLELYQDGKQIYKEYLTGMRQTSLYQVTDDNRTHKFEITIFSIENLSTTATKTMGGDRNPPIITIANKVITNENKIRFKTDDDAKCGANFIQNVTYSETTYETEHSIEIAAKEGTSKLYIRCTDEEDNLMLKPIVIDFILDTQKPGKVTNLNFTVIDGQTKLSWDAAEDTNGIDHYTIYNSLKELATTKNTYWTAETNDSTYFISAVDKAGNEGEKQEYGFMRELLLRPSIEENVPVQPKEEVKEEVMTENKKISWITITAWSVFGILVIVFIGWKIYEHKTDRHGMKRYLKQRRKMRDLDVNIKK